MRLVRLHVHDFRCYADASVEVGEGLTVLAGPNGAGKTNLLEGLYFACTGRSCRTTNEREVVRFGAAAARATAVVDDDAGRHELAVGFSAGQPKRMKVDGAPVDRLLDSPHRPLVSVFLPDRLELVKGPPALRRAHLDQFVAALWPARVATRRAYAQALAQRNALISRIRAGVAAREQLPTWDLQLARHGISLMADRAAAVGGLERLYASLAGELGLGPVEEQALVYRPRSRASTAEALAAEMSERVEGDLQRGYTGHGPHRDELALLRQGHELRAYGSQGQQRLALLALLLAERRALAAAGRPMPLLLLDDVMSELDRERRERLVDLLREDEGQALITTTDLEHVPGGEEAGVLRLHVDEGRILSEAPAA